jgi:hypothetical protein
VADWSVVILSGTAASLDATGASGANWSTLTVRSSNLALMSLTVAAKSRRLSATAFKSIFKSSPMGTQQGLSDTKLLWAMELVEGLL